MVHTKIKPEVELFVTYRVARVVPVSHPLSDGRPPVLEKKLLGVLFAVTSPVAALSPGLRNLVFSVQVNLDPFSHPRGDSGLGAPGSAVMVFSQPNEGDTNT